MWWTQIGERVLTGAEAELFGHALGVVLDEVEEAHRDAQSEDDEWTASLTAFDDLTYGQKIQVFATVAEGLLLPEVPKVRLTAAVEAGVAAVYEQLKTYVEMEIDAEDLPDEDERDRQRRETYRHFWRRKILAVCDQYGMQEPDPSDPESDEPVTEGCADKEQWDLLIERIMGRILWDRDYEDGDLLLDLPPEGAREVRELLGITTDYHQAIPDDLTEKQAAAALARIKQLLHKVAPA